jgi:hypothetical protein
LAAPPGAGSGICPDQCAGSAPAVIAIEPLVGFEPERGDQSSAMLVI